MPRTVNPDWSEDFSAGTIQDVYHVQFTLGDGSTREFISGSETLGNAELGLAGVDITPSKVDPFSRKATVSEWTLTFVDDDILRELIAQTSPTLLGARVDVKRGTVQLHDGDFDDFVTVGNKLVVIEIKPERGSIGVVVRDSTGLVLEDEISPYARPQPVLRMIKGFLEANLSSSLVDSDSFESKDYPDYSHINVATHLYGYSAFADWAVLIDSEERAPDPSLPPTLRVTQQSAARVSIVTLIDDLNFLTRGTTYRGEDGRWTFVNYNREGTGIRHFTKDEISDFQQISTYQDMINSFRIDGHYAFGWTGASYISGIDEDSRSDFGWEDSPNPNIPYTRHKTITNRWFQGFVPMMYELGLSFGPSNIELAIQTAGYRGFPGMWQEDGAGVPIVPPSETQQDEHKLNAGAGRYGWFKITDSKANGKREIVRATSVQFKHVNDTTVGYTQINTKEGPLTFWRNPVYTVDRADGSDTFFGTTAQNWTEWTTAARSQDVFIYDVTSAKYVLDTVLDRMSRGMPMISFNVNAVNDDIKLGELVSLQTDLFLKDGLNGAGASTLFELISKQPTTSGKMKFTCAFVRDGAAGTALVPTYEDPNDEDIVPVMASTQELLGLIGTAIHDIYGNDNNKMRVT